MIEQISIFAENKKGAMCAVTDVLERENINMQALVTNDSAEFGIIRMLTSDPDAAYRAFQKAGYLVHRDPVIAVDMEDRPGCLNHLLHDIEKVNINIDYLYISFDRDFTNPIAVIKAPDQDTLEECLTGLGYHVR